jgi:hypothetical protein
VLAKVYDAYLGLSAEWQECFVFHACIVGEKTEVERNVGQLKRLAQEQPFKVEFRFFIFDNGTVKEIS